MALSESALSELLVALTDRERGVDLVRELAQYLAQELIEVQATETIGAARYERSDERVTERNGHRDRVLTTKAGDLELAISSWRSRSCAGAASSRASWSRAGASTKRCMRS
jgi:putative transposase